MSDFDWCFKEDVIEEKDDGSVEKDVTQKASFMTVAQLKRSTHKLKRLKELSGLPKKNEHQVMFVNSQFDAITFLDFILDVEKEIEILALASYSYSRLAATSIKNYIENDIVKKCILASTTSLRSRYTQSYAILENIQGDIETKYTSLHTKILLAKCEENYYVLTGSGNFAKNARIEQYNFVNNKELFYFYLNNIEELETKKSS